MATQRPPNHPPHFPRLPPGSITDVSIRRALYKQLVHPAPSLQPSRARAIVLSNKGHFCSILVFILTLLLLSADFYYLKNIAGRRLVGLRWWNEVNTTTGDSHWVFESADPNTRTISATDKRFFWLSLYVAPALWIGLGILAIVRLNSVIWLSLIGTYTFLRKHGLGFVVVEGC